MNPEEKNIHEQFVQLGTAAKEAVRKCALMLPEIMRRGIWKKKGYESIHEYARVFAGMSSAAVDEALRVLNKIQDKPALLEVAAMKGVSAVRPVAAIATLETSSFWAEKAKAMSRASLEKYVHEVRRRDRANGHLDVKNEADFLPGKFPEAEKVSLDVRVSRELAERLEKLRDGGTWETLFSEFLIYREKVLESEKPETTEDAARYIPAEIVKFILIRSRGICEFGDCRRKYEILHHIQRFALEPVHDPVRMVALCKAHEQIVHMSLVEDEALPPKQWKVIPEADYDNPKYAIDRLVQAHRQKS